MRSESVWKNDIWVRPLLKKYGRAFAFALFLSVCTFIFAAALMFTSGYMISLAAAIPLTVLALHIPSLFVRIFGIGKPLIRYGERLTSHDWVLRMTSQMRRKLYDTLDAQTDVSRPNKTFGQVIELLTEDIGHVQNIILRSVLPLLSAWLLVLLIIVACGMLSIGLMAAISLLLVMIAFVIPLASASLNSVRIAKMRSLQHELYENLADNVYGISDWVLSGRKNDYLAYSDRHLKQRQDLQNDINRFNRRCDLLNQILFGISIVAILIWASLVFGEGIGTTGATQAIANSGSENAPAYAANWIAAFVLCFFPLTEAFAPLPRAAMDYKRQTDAIKHLNSLSAKSNSDESSHEFQNTATKTCNKPDIKIENVSFTYKNGSNPILNNLSIQLPFGQKVAVLGRSGVGKTTLASLLYGDIIPSSGYIEIDGSNPLSYGDSLNKVVGIMQQTPQLLNLSLRENLLIGKPNASDAELVDALHRVELGGLLSRLPKGFDTPVSESGMNFSGGERHRIALARILLANQPIVILDEPFTGLDVETERALLDSFLNALKEKTVIVITHHLANIHRFDRVLFLQDPSSGKSSLSFDGTPTDLAKVERFSALLTMDDRNLPASCRLK